VSLVTALSAKQAHVYTAWDFLRKDTDSERDPTSGDQTKVPKKRTEADVSTTISIISKGLEPSVSTTVSSRYTDAYREARMVVWIGQLIKTVGWILGVILGCGAVAAYLTQGQPQRATFGSPFSGAYGWLAAILAICAIITVCFFWAWGVLVCSKGQQLKASIDCAVNSSPFLSDEQRATVMSLD
jgi:hypothetical protein